MEQISGKTVGGDDGGDGHEGDAQLPGAVAAEVHQRAAAHDHHIVGLALKALHAVLDQALFAVQALGLQHDLLVGLHVHHAGQIVGVGVIDHRAVAGETRVLHVPVKALQRAVFAHHQLGAQLMVAPACAGAEIFRGIENHSLYPPESFFSHTMLILLYPPSICNAYLSPRVRCGIPAGAANAAMINSRPAAHHGRIFRC